MAKKKSKKPKKGKKAKRKVSKKEIKKCQKDIQKLKKEISKTVVGQTEIVNGVIRAIISNGHVLVEGVPGIGKTLLIRTLAKITGGIFNRIQFTVDLLPTDITGVRAYNPKKGFYTIKGPVFANFILADEINRASPKVQSALLEAMQEKQTTIAKKTYSLPQPFFVMATQNPLEAEGVYPLPEAQKDRFIFKLLMDYPDTKEERDILKQNITATPFEEYNLKKVLTPKRIIKIQDRVKDVAIDKDIEEYIVSLVDASRFPKKHKIKSGKYVEVGCSPRASIALFLGSKADALLKGKNYVTPQNVKNVTYGVMRHRILINYEGEAENVQSDDIIKEILSKVPVP